MTVIRIPRHWCGPDGIGQGGVTAGLLADGLSDEPVEVRLHAPAPLDVDMDVVPGDVERVLVAAPDTRIATVRGIDALEGVPPAVVDLGTARKATGALRHLNPFGRCVVCGHRRDDSLRVWPGPLPDGRPGVATVIEPPADRASAAPFVDGRGMLATPFVFGALDCTSGFAVLRETDGGLVITGTMQVQLVQAVPAETPVIATAQVTGRGGRTWRVGAALYAPDGDLLARAHVIWVEIDASVLAPALG